MYVVPQLVVKIEDDSTALRPLGVLCRLPSRDGWWWLLLDLFLTHGLLHPAMICVWWSLWNLEGNYLLTPCEMAEKDAVVWDSVIIGYLAAVLVMPLTALVQECEEGWARRFGGDCLAWIALVSSLNVWRGVWSVADYHFFPVSSPRFSSMTMYFLLKGCVLCTVV